MKHLQERLHLEMLNSEYYIMNYTQGLAWCTRKA